jgi:hypothetical protein
MSLPEWGRSYNALSVPLTSDWQCSLVPSRDVREPIAWWSLSYDQRQQYRKDREEQIDHDRRDFNRLFRVSTSRRTARACSDFSAYAAFIREHLRISGSAPVDGEGITRALLKAVCDGRLIPAIDRAWRGSRRVARFYAPQSWPKRVPDPKPIVYGVRNGQFIPLNPDGTFVDYTPYVPVKVVVLASSVAGSIGGFDWLDAAQTAAGAIPAGDAASCNVGALDDDFANGADDDSTLLADAQAFDYQPDTPDGDSFDIAKTPNEGEPGTWYTNPGSGQMRMYGDDGQPVVDFDFDHDHGQGNPHAHNWDDGVRGPGVSFSPL